ncbi:SRPBCC family protein [Variovorax sp. J22P271]|uniref:CoxG family protein n=1 Tax=Variovorax davisae TaxID=3053515 RepID=UPI002577BF8B|nr:SRPBCC family protein [Variovorax sp. J22P271]MDM0037076.1 SRPBCC family protein [Variovorax sp. J22P271]
MEIEKTMTVAAPAAQVWQMLLDPNVMGSCVPGMKSIEVVSEVEYIAQIHVKISFISAKFKLRTTIVEQRAPHYLRCEGTGEDASVASSLKQQSELFLAELPDGRTELRMKVKVDVLGRLGTFGLSVMKTKADRMWEEFGQNLVARLEGGPALAAAPARAPVAGIPAAAPARVAVAAQPVAAVAAPAAASVALPPAAVSTAPAAAGRGWWSRLVHGSAADGRHIRIELQRGDTLLKVDWPVEAAAECSAWLRDVTK